MTTRTFDQLHLQISFPDEDASMNQVDLHPFFNFFGGIDPSRIHGGGSRSLNHLGLEGLDITIPVTGYIILQLLLDISMMFVGDVSYNFLGSLVGVSFITVF
jgi:hypothetical protein